MNPDDNSADSTSVLKELRQQLLKHLAEYIAALSAIIAGVFLQAYGDSIFDSLVHALGKKKLLQIGALLLCSLGWCIFWIWQTKRNKLIFEHGLYWAKNGKIPFCPHCHETKKQNVHLNLFQHRDEKYVAYSCSNCDHAYAADSGKDFQISV